MVNAQRMQRECSNSEGNCQDAFLKIEKADSHATDRLSLFVRKAIHFNKSIFRTLVKDLVTSRYV